MAVQSPLGSTTEDHEKTGYLTRTSNGFGWQMNILDEYGELFVDYVRTCKRPIADLGVAYGYTSKQLLAAGAYVIANDLSPKMLDELRNSVRDDERKRLVLMPGNALDLDIAEGTLDGVWANRFLHFLEPQQVLHAFRKFESWLAPGGKLCITASSPYFSLIAGFLPQYQANRAAGHEWPGFMGLDSLTQEWKDATNEYQVGHAFDTEVIEREAKRVGLQVEKCGYLPRPYASTNGKEGVGLIAMKPYSQ